MPVIHNRGKQIGDKTVARKIHFPKGWDAKGHPVRGDDNKVLEEVLEPGAHKTVTDEQFKHLKANFHAEIINVDDMKDMQAQFKAKPVDYSQQGYVAPQDVDALVEKRAQELAAGRARDEEDKKGLPDDAEPEITEALIKRIDAMDRTDLIALIEKEQLGIDHGKLKAPGLLKSAVLTAIENKKAAASTAEKIDTKTEE